MSLTKKFMDAFEGFSAAHGQTQISEERREGKQKAKSFIVRKPLTIELIQSHLDGKCGVGSIPINEDNKCRFGALDIDQYPLDLVALDKKIRDLGVSCVVCRSKSGGAHVFFFFTDWISAGDFKDKAAEVSAVLGYGGCEVFPKQEQVLVERGDVGNFINLPYFDAEQTFRPAVKEDGEDATLEEFLELIEQRRTTPSDFLSLKLGGTSDQFKGWPPCLKTMFEQGIPEGGRNTTMFAAAVACKRVDPDNWKSLHEQINMSYCNPPLPASEIVQIQQQLEKKEYFYPCDQQPLASFCNKSLCRRQKYGIGKEVIEADISGLSVVLSEPRVWFCDINGRRLELNTEELQMPMKFQRACMEHLQYMPPTMKNADWQIIVNGLMENVNEIEVPEELTYKGQFFDHLESFCTGRVQAQSAEELLLGKPYTDEGLTFFRFDSLMTYLQNKKFTEYNRGQIQERLKELNGESEAHGVKRFRTTKGDSKQIRVWWVPEYSSNVDMPEVHVPSSEVPF
jgi:hypothetical protein